MKLLSAEEKARLRTRHLHDQIGAIAPQAIRATQASRRADGRPRLGPIQRRAYLRRAERLERESGQR